MSRARLASNHLNGIKGRVIRIKENAEKHHPKHVKKLEKLLQQLEELVAEMKV